MHRLAWNAGVGYKLRPLLSRRPPTPAPLAENARLLCMKWLWRVWYEVARPRATAVRHLDWPVGSYKMCQSPPPPPPTAIISARQRGCNSPLFSRGGGRSGRRDVMIDRRVHFHSLLYRNFKIFLLFLLLVSASLLWNGLRMDREDWSSAVQAYFVIYIT